MRLFTAIELPEEIRRHLVDLQKRYAGEGPWRAVSWTRPENLHVTLKFLGEVAEQAVPDLCKAMAAIELDGGEIELTIQGVEFLPERGPIRIVAAGVGGQTDRLARLFEAIEAAIEPLGIAREGRAFRPHITIGRARDMLPAHLRRPPQGQPVPAPQPERPFVAEQFILMQSDLSRGGPTYTRAASFPLQ